MMKKDTAVLNDSIVFEKPPYTHTTPVSLVEEEPLPYRGLGTHQEPTNQSTTSPGATGIGPEAANQD